MIYVNLKNNFAYLSHTTFYKEHIRAVFTQTNHHRLRCPLQNEIGIAGMRLSDEQCSYWRLSPQWQLVESRSCYGRVCWSPTVTRRRRRSPGGWGLESWEAKTLWSRDHFHLIGESVLNEIWDMCWCTVFLEKYGLPAAVAVIQCFMWSLRAVR